MGKKNRKVLVLLLVLMMILAGCGSSGNSNSVNSSPDSSSSGGNDKGASAPDAPPFVTIGSAASGSSLYLYGTALAELLKNNLKYSQFDVEETGGAIANINMVENGDIEIGLTPVGVLHSAMQGTGKFEGKPVQNVTLGWKIAPTVAHFVTLESSGLKTLEDLKGKRVSIGASGSAANDLAVKLIEDHGIKASDVTFSYMDWNSGIEALSDGAIDVALVLGTLPAPTIESLGVQKPIRILSMKPDVVSKNPARTVYTIPANTYAGQSEEAVTAAEEMYVFFRKDLSEQVVYDIAKLGISSTDQLGKVHSMGAVADLITEKDFEFLGGELHPGVAKYVQEIDK